MNSVRRNVQVILKGTKHSKYCSSLSICLYPSCYNLHVLICCWMHVAGDADYQTFLAAFLQRMLQRIVCTYTNQDCVCPACRIFCRCMCRRQCSLCWSASAGCPLLQAPYFWQNTSALHQPVSSFGSCCLTTLSLQKYQKQILAPSPRRTA